MGGYGKKGGKGRIIMDGEKVRNVEYIIYPDNVFVPRDALGELLATPHGRIVSYLESARIKCALSPLHHSDVYDLEDVIAYRDRWAKRHELPATAEEVIANSPEVGEPKEPHYHLDVYAQAPHVASWWRDWIYQLCPDYPAWRIWRVDNPEAATLYLSHKGQKDKARYRDDEVEGFGGMDLSVLYRPSDVEKVYTLNDVREAIRENGIKFMNQLLDWALDTGDYQLICSVRGNAGLWRDYLGGRTSEREAKRERRNISGDLIG